MELKLKRRELKIDVYGKDEVMRFPTFEEQLKYESDLNKEDAVHYDVTVAFFILLGMNEETVKTLELPDIIEIGSIVTGQKKI